MEADLTFDSVNSQLPTLQPGVINHSPAAIPCLNSSLFLSILLGLVVIGLIFYVNFGSKTLLSRRRNLYLITGLSGSGKTSLFSVLRTQKHVATYTSIKSNEMLLRPVGDESEPLTKDALCIIDIPGHEKLRNLEISRVIDEAKALVVVVDSFTANKSISQVAAMMYDLLVLKPVIKYEIPVLVVVNKRDLATSVTPERLKTLLESEINTIRHTRTSHLESLGSDHPGFDLTSQEFLGVEDKAFQFEDIPNKLTFLPLSLGSAGNMINQDQVREVVAWLVSR